MAAKSPHEADVAERLKRAAGLRARGHHAEAVKELEHATRLAPTHAEAQHQLGNALKAAGRIGDAVHVLFTASSLAPNDPTVWVNLGVALLDTQVPAAAVMAFEHAAKLAPEHPEIQNVLGVAYIALGRNGDAIAAFENALHLQPTHAGALDNLARAHRNPGRVDEAIAYFRRALALEANPITHSNLLYTLNFSSTVSPDDVAAEHRLWSERWTQPLPSTQKPHDNNRDPLRRLRIGYVSADFNQHAVGYFIEPVIAAHSREAVEVYGYADGHVADAAAKRMEASTDRWVPVVALSDEQLAARIRNDAIDILVDLAGHTARNRLAVFGMRPAPIQVTWIGYPNTTGLSTIDYRFTDFISDPLGETEQWHAETLLRLPEVFSCYGPPADAPAVSDLPARASNMITFGCFNNLSKMTPDVVAVWSSLLNQIDGSRLRLRSRALEDAGTVALVFETFAKHGVSADRINLDGRYLSVADHLEAYSAVDIALDPFPYNGTTTTCEALYMGVSVLTLAGRTHAARVGASLLTHVGLNEWIATSAEDLVSRGCALAADRNALAALRATLRDRMRASPLCDAPRFAAFVEQAYRAMWTAYCADEPKITAVQYAPVAR